MTLSEKKGSIINTLLDHQGLQCMINLSEKLMNNPVFIFDMSGKVHAKSQSAEAKGIWDKIIPNDCLTADNLKILEDADAMEQMISAGVPVMCQVSYCPYRLLGCGVRDMDSAVGAVIVVEVRQISGEDKELLAFLCKTALFEILYRERTTMQVIPYYSLFRDIIEGHVKESAVRERCRVMKLKIPERMYLLGIKVTSVKQNSISLHFVREQMMAFMPSCFCIIYDESLLVVIEDKYLKPSLIDRINHTFASYELRIGISRMFNRIMGLKRAFGEIKAIQRVFAKLQIDKPLAYYNDILFYHFMGIMSEKCDLNEFCHSSVKTLEEYDKRNQTELLAGVEAYVESGRNIQKASQKLGIHKNTLYYRLKKAEAAADIDLYDEDTCFNIQFSIRMKKMIS